MQKMIKMLNSNQRGSVFVENALIIIGLALAVAPFMMALGSTLGDKIDEIKTEVEQVGN
ncbi:MAG: hypothetical protein K6T65_15510 [Peptococcaceae bacterium]|nr:hypothetical protein [Peptococcaceae bacterium]